MEIDRDNAPRDSRGQHFARARAIQTHVDISQEPFCMEISGKMPNPPPGDIVLCEPAQSKRTWTCHYRSHFVWKLIRTMSNAPPGTSFCASLRLRNGHGHFTKTILYGNLHEKCQTPLPGTSFCAGLHSQHAHGHVTRAILYGN